VALQREALEHYIKRETKLMAKGKLVTVVKEVREQYEVDAGTGALSDDQAIETVKARMSAGSPLGLVDDPKVKITGFEVTEKD
jgi:hypothetical protein